MKNIDLASASEQHFQRIHRAALVLTGNPWDADDLAQETFLVLARQLQRFEGRSSLYTYLYGILVNLERRHRRRRGVMHRKLQVLWDGEPSAERSAPAAETPIEVAEWKQGLWAHVARLPDGQRLALVLRYSEHLRYDEIADILDCPLGTVKSRIHHALLALRTAMAASGDDTPDVIPPHAWEDVSHAV